jgi:hypothetical protein
VKLTKEVHVYLTEPAYADQASSYYVSNYDGTPEGWVRAHTLSVTFDSMATADAARAGVELLNAKRELLREEFEESMRKIQEQISKFQALTYSE